MEKTAEIEIRGILVGMMNDVTYVTTRGTTGDADGIVAIDQDYIDAIELDFTKIIPLRDLEEIDGDAYLDMVDYIHNHAPNTTVEEYFTIINGDENTYILAWD